MGVVTVLAGASLGQALLAQPLGGRVGVAPVLLQRPLGVHHAGAMDTGAGRLVIKVPGVIENAKDILSLPIKVSGGTVVTFKDVTSLRRVYKDPESFARLNGQPALVLEVSKRVGTNIIETIESVRKVGRYGFG